MLQVTLIVAASNNNVIGVNNQMPWHLPNDFKYFKANTMDHSIIMGRKTYDSIGKPLPGRRNIILTRDQNYQNSEVDIANSISEVFNYCRDEREIFILGGADIFKQALALANRVLLTRVHADIQGDTFFPELNPAEWQLVSQDMHFKDEKHAFDYTFEVWEKK